MPQREYPSTSYRLRSEAEAAIPTPHGFCLCGCGQRTAVARDTNAGRGDRRGEPVKFVLGHASRLKANYRVEERGFRTPCWVWAGTLTEAGYARVVIDGRSQQVHRWAFEQSRRPIPRGMQLDHLCRVRACVNPDHLEPVTQAENSRRGSNATLTWASAILVRYLRVSTTLSMTHIAEIVGVDRTTVKQILTQHTWKTPL